MGFKPMPIFIVYPAEPEVLKQVIDALGEPRDLEVGFSVRDERLRELFKPDGVEWITIQYTCKPKAERALELYREFYEDYVSVGKGVRTQVSDRLRTVSRFKARWYVDGLSAEFDGFKLKIRSRGNVSKAVEIIQLFGERAIGIDIDLSNKEV